jgi:hypothetical protein
VELQAVRKSIAVLSDDELKRFDVLVLIGVNPVDLIAINNKARKYGILFFATEQFGYQSFLFSDLLTHRFVDERKKQGLSGETVSKRERVFEYPSLEACLSHKFGMPDSTIKGGRRWLKSVHPQYFAVAGALR